jgi:hypothetical protein
MTETTQPQTPEEIRDALLALNRDRPEGDPFAFALMAQIRDAEFELDRATSQLRVAAERVRDRAASVIRELDRATDYAINELGVLQGSGSELDRLASERHLADKNLGNVLRVATSYLAS